jgi:PAS domain S-box-containing protein
MDEMQYINILAVEDDDVDCTALDRYVKQKGLPYKIHRACTQTEALKNLKKSKFDVVLLDYNLGNATALDILPNTGDTPVIIVTGSGTEEIAVDAMRKGARDYLIKDPDRNYLKVLPLTILNVLDRKRAERDLHESEERLRTTLNSISDLVFSLDNNGHLIDFHQPDEHPDLYVPPQEFYGKLFADVLPKEVAEPLQQIVDIALESGDIQKVEYPLTFSGDTRWFEAKVSRRINRLGETSGATVVVRNITDRKNAEHALQKSRQLLEQRVEERTAELKEANRKLKQEIKERKKSEAALKKSEEHLRQAQKMEAIGSLAGGIAHDFNNILGIIIGYTELALDDVPGDSLIAANLDQVLAASGRGREMVKQILAFSRKDEYERTSIYLKEILDDTLKLLRSTLPASIVIRSEIQENLEPVLADMEQLKQVIMNICTNAAHAMRDQGGILTLVLKEISIQAGDSESHQLEPGNYQKISFSDTGFGMKPDVIRRIFEPYYTTKDQGEGSGMGLAVAHGILKNHGGDITVNSQVGQGTTFNIFLPAQNHHQAHYSDSNPSLASEMVRILLVDDEQPLLDMGRQLLGKMGYSVEAVNKSKTALELFIADPDGYDIVITDQTMPGLTGIQLAQEIRQINPHVAIVLCTGFSEQVNKENVRNLGINRFIMKPIVKKEIQQAIQSLVHKK